MRRFSILLAMMVTMLAGCGQVVVFGHVVRQGSGAKVEDAAPAGNAQPDGEGPTAPNGAVPAAANGAQLAAAKSSAVAIAHPLKAVNLTVTPEAAAKVTGDASRFNAAALLAAIKTELQSRKLLDEQGAQASGTAEVVVDDLATRPTTNAIVFGYKMLAGTLEGDVRITGADGGESTGSRIIAQSKLTLAASGDDKNPLGPLYHRFAVLTADRLAGVTSPPQESAGPPRF